MATSLLKMQVQSTKVFQSLLSNAKPLQIVSCRLKGGFSVRIKRKRPIQKWFDPANKSWAEPILEQQKRKEREAPQPPSMLHMVYRIKDHYTRPFWEKDVLKEFGLFEKVYSPVVLKNTPEVNERLRLVQHLVKIKPVTFPYGLPKDEIDYKYCFLNEKGEFIVKHRLASSELAEQNEAWAEVKVAEERTDTSDIWKMDSETIKKECRRVLDGYKLSEEYFKEKYVYRHNQDGKEDRYTGNHNVGNRRPDWY